ncbi:MAG: hypothetical protein COW67_09245 [Flavobacteriales bacterium CG18_big_fil_WC_8_21_14_2_50_32_9]|nr:MAG: hypothetical protein COW67_09245 [Flavobacteriales bacterium CG18_big_fil_WC_8_21_14_2_50_32_9]
MMYSLSGFPPVWGVLVLSILIFILIESIVVLVVDFLNKDCPYLKKTFSVKKILIIISLIIFLGGLVHLIVININNKLRPVDILFFWLSIISVIYIVGCLLFYIYKLQK